MISEPSDKLSPFPPARSHTQRLPGNEAGGHGGKAAPSTMVMLSEILAALPAEYAPPVLAAGGISNGSQAAAYLVAGAAGVVLGTRFALTAESPYPDYNKAAIQRARSSDTVRTHALDWAWNLYSWPESINGRGIRTKIVDDWEDFGIASLRSISA
ncbi:hypothetical protein NUW54_g11479 [Trametes sanguinea]|uniref:Uncharacterized protein n=1 Tax=Trametes sanguinea TaxID=158606 RepID=A0ACC1ND64_9APHY|nr:hypothetical protein NUW54_g11479 [Trametes sanguinea]